MATVTALDAARVLAVRRDVWRSPLAVDRRFASNFYLAFAISLADRLLSTTSRLGYGKLGQDAAPGALDELSEDLRETVSLGTRRFDNLLKRICYIGARADAGDPPSAWISRATECL